MWPVAEATFQRTAGSMNGQNPVRSARVQIDAAATTFVPSDAEA
jgi:hypothetical protein